MNRRCFSEIQVAATEGHSDPQTALQALRGGIDHADRHLLESIATATNSVDIKKLAAAFTDRFRQIFQACPAERVNQAAESLVSAMQRIFPSSLDESSANALVSCFSHRAQVRQYKKTTRDPAREDEVRTKWRESAGELQLDPDQAEELYGIVLQTSVQMQELQVSHTSAL